MAEIIARFADGRLLVQESRVVEQGYKMSGYSTYGVPVRVGHVNTIEKVLSIDSSISGYPANKVVTRLEDVKISGDTLLVMMRRGDLGVPVTTGIVSGISVASGKISGIVTLTGTVASGNAALNVLSGLTSGLGFMEELTSGLSALSGLVTVTANVVGY